MSTSTLTRPGVPAARAARADTASAVAQSYLRALEMIERSNARLLEAIKDELDRRGVRAINNVQALLLFHLGDRTLTAGELRARGCYLRSNVSHNLRKLVEAGYVRQERCTSDHRAVLVSLAEKGRAVHDMLSELFARHLASLEAAADVHHGDLEAINDGLRRLERFWIDQVRFRL